MLHQLYDHWFALHRFYACPCLHLLANTPHTQQFADSKQSCPRCPVQTKLRALTRPCLHLLANTPCTQHSSSENKSLIVSIYNLIYLWSKHKMHTKYKICAFQCSLFLLDCSLSVQKRTMTVMRAHNLGITMSCQFQSDWTKTGSCWKFTSTSENNCQLLVGRGSSQCSQRISSCRRARNICWRRDCNLCTESISQSETCSNSRYD